ncbi:MAG: prenyltransferase/squalene oxidase repeat-containing protein [Planctomycetota bacterium]|jgi:hypothetical protein
MRIARPILLVLVLCFVSRQGASVWGDEAPAALEDRVNAAIDRGAAWLQGQQRQDGSYPGFGDHLPANAYNPMDVGLNALVIHTLAHCGIGKDDDSIEKCLRFCRFHYAGGNGSWNLKGNGKVMVYTAATLIMALDAIHRAGRRPEPPIKRDRYGNPIPPRIRPCKIPSQDRKWIEELVAFIVKCQVKPDGGWRYPGNPVASEEGVTDLSNTQYALLALDTAARCGFDVPDETWRLAAEYVLREQEEEGIEVPVFVENEAWSPEHPELERFLEVAKAEARGWCYLPGQVTLSTGSMTCAGVTCLALAKERLWAQKALPDVLSRRIDRGLVDGLAWLSDHFTVEDNPDPPNQWHYYYLYGLERTGAKTGVTYIGTHDWYREGAEHLLAAQLEHGGWAEAEASGKPADATESAITQTCFALLFLERATRPPVIPVTPPVLTGGGEDD